MGIEEFCVATISPYQLEALENWEQIASAAFENFEREGNRVISVEELAEVPSKLDGTLCILDFFTNINMMKSLCAGDEPCSSSLFYCT